MLSGRTHHQSLGGLVRAWCFAAGRWRHVVSWTSLSCSIPSLSVAGSPPLSYSYSSTCRLCTQPLTTHSYPRHANQTASNCCRIYHHCHHCHHKLATQITKIKSTINMYVYIVYYTVIFFKIEINTQLIY